MTNGLEMDSISSHEDLDIDALNDSQLYEKLKENNIAAGPIVDSTREVYKKKLRKVLYGDDEESFVSGGEPELDSDEPEDEIVADKDESLANGNLTGPIVEEEAEEEVVDGVTENKSEEEVVDGVTESKSDTDDDQPSGVSRPVEDPSGLRKRVTGNDAEFKEATKEYGTDPLLDVKSKTSPLMFVVVFLVILAGAAIAMYFLSTDMPDAVDSMQEAIQEAANKAASGIDVEEDFAKAANKAIRGTDQEEDFKATSGEDGEEVFTI